jgi:hypothetical protein
MAETKPYRPLACNSSGVSAVNKLGAFMWLLMIVLLSSVGCTTVDRHTEPEHDRISQGAVQ